MVFDFMLFASWMLHGQRVAAQPALARRVAVDPFLPQQWTLTLPTGEVQMHVFMDGKKWVPTEVVDLESGEEVDLTESELAHLFSMIEPVLAKRGLPPAGWTTYMFCFRGVDERVVGGDRVHRPARLRDGAGGRDGRPDRALHAGAAGCGSSRCMIRSQLHRFVLSVLVSCCRATIERSFLRSLEVERSALRFRG